MHFQLNEQQAHNIVRQPNVCARNQLICMFVCCTNLSTIENVFMWVFEENIYLIVNVTCLTVKTYKKNLQG